MKIQKYTSNYILNIPKKEICLSVFFEIRFLYLLSILNGEIYLELLKYGLDPAIKNATESINIHQPYIGYGNVSAGWSTSPFLSSGLRIFKGEISWSMNWTKRCHSIAHLITKCFIIRFFVWSHIKNSMYATQPGFLEELK